MPHKPSPALQPCRATGPCRRAAAQDIALGGCTSGGQGSHALPPPAACAAAACGAAGLCLRRGDRGRPVSCRVAAARASPLNAATGANQTRCLKLRPFCYASALPLLSRVPVLIALGPPLARREVEECVRGAVKEALAAMPAAVDVCLLFVAGGQSGRCAPAASQASRRWRAAVARSRRDHWSGGKTAGRPCACCSELLSLRISQLWCAFPSPPAGVQGAGCRPPGRACATVPGTAAAR